MLFAKLSLHLLLCSALGSSSVVAIQEVEKDMDGAPNLRISQDAIYFYTRTDNGVIFRFTANGLDRMPTPPSPGNNHWYVSADGTVYWKGLDRRPNSNPQAFLLSRVKAGGKWEPCLNFGQSLKLDDAEMELKDVYYLWPDNQDGFIAFCNLSGVKEGKRRTTNALVRLNSSSTTMIASGDTPGFPFTNSMMQPSGGVNLWPVWTSSGVLIFSCNDRGQWTQVAFSSLRKESWVTGTGLFAAPEPKNFEINAWENPKTNGSTSANILAYRAESDAFKPGQRTPLNGVQLPKEKIEKLYVGAYGTVFFADSAWRWQSKPSAALVDVSAAVKKNLESVSQSLVLKGCQVIPGKESSRLLLHVSATDESLNATQKEFDELWTMDEKGVFVRVWGGGEALPGQPETGTRKINGKTEVYPIYRKVDEIYRMVRGSHFAYPAPNPAPFLIVTPYARNYLVAWIKW